MDKKKIHEVDGDVNAYQTWKEKNISEKGVDVQDIANLPEHFLEAEPDLAIHPTPKVSPELEAAIELLQDGGLQTLTPTQQKIFQLSVVEGLSTRKVGTQMNISHRAVQQHLEAIGKKLRPQVEERM